MGSFVPIPDNYVQAAAEAPLLPMLPLPPCRLQQPRPRLLLPLGGLPFRLRPAMFRAVGFRARLCGRPCLGLARHAQVDDFRHRPPYPL